MTLKELVGKLQAAIPQLRQRANRAMDGLPPLESLELGQETAAALRAFTYMAQEMEEIENWVSSLLPAYEDAENALVAATAQKLLEDGDHVTVKDRDAQVAHAKSEGREEAAQEFKAAEALRQKAEERRQEAEKTVGVKAAAALPAETLAGDGHELVVTAMAARLESMKKVGITEEMDDVYRELIAIGFDDEGKSTFQARLKSYESYAEAMKKPTGNLRASGGTPPFQAASGAEGGAAGMRSLGFA